MLLTLLLVINKFTDVIFCFHLCKELFSVTILGMYLFASCQVPEVWCICCCSYSFAMNLWVYAAWALLGYFGLVHLHLWVTLKTLSNHFSECPFQSGPISFNLQDTEDMYPSYFVIIPQLFLVSDHPCKSISRLVQIREFLLLYSKFMDGLPPSLHSVI